jgi:AcrR family transcriptional regulator
MNRGPRRVLPREEVAKVLRLHAGGLKPDAIAREVGISKRTVYRYLADPEHPRARRIRKALEDWPGKDALTEPERDDLVGWLFDALAGWHE